MSNAQCYLVATILLTLSVRSQIIFTIQRHCSGKRNKQCVSSERRVPRKSLRVTFWASVPWILKTRYSLIQNKSQMGTRVESRWLSATSRERERKSVCVWVCEWMCVCVCVCVCVCRILTRYAKNHLSAESGKGLCNIRLYSLAITAPHFSERHVGPPDTFADDK